MQYTLNAKECIMCKVFFLFNKKMQKTNIHIKKYSNYRYLITFKAKTSPIPYIIIFDRKHDFMQFNLKGCAKSDLS